MICDKLSVLVPCVAILFLFSEKLKCFVWKQCSFLFYLNKYKSEYIYIFISIISFHPFLGLMAERRSSIKEYLGF